MGIWVKKGTKIMKNGIWLLTYGFERPHFRSSLRNRGRKSPTLGIAVRVSSIFCLVKVGERTKKNSKRVKRLRLNNKRINKSIWMRIMS